MGTTFSRRLLAIFCNFFIIFFCVNAYAEYCFEVPDRKVHEASTRANRIVFQMGVDAYSSFEEILNKNIERANSKIGKIRKGAETLEWIYAKIGENIRDRDINTSVLTKEDRGYLNFLMDKHSVERGRSTRGLVGVGIKEIALFKRIMQDDRMKYGEDSEDNFSTINDVISFYNRLTRIGFIISQTAFEFKHPEPRQYWDY